MSDNPSEKRSAILKRLIMTIICLIAFEAVEILLLLVVLFQYGQMLILGKRNENVRKFGNKLSWYGYRILRYATLNENGRPFPFGSLPTDAEVEAPARSVHFN
ncbi:MAG: DUF4389 domain-containing protein [Proteobacteria bacterium]|nr:DUF4389 domain-containing protein [Pseudomonadota bacterium]